MQHTCGKAEALIEDFIDTGVAAWSSVQPTNDIPEILSKYGNKICICGGYNTNGAPGRTDATEEQIREEVRRCMNEYGKYRGFIFFGFLLANSLDPKDKLTSLLPMIQRVIGKIIVWIFSKKNLPGSLNLSKDPGRF